MELYVIHIREIIRERGRCLLRLVLQTADRQGGVTPNATPL
jgi:hypothetical protein